MGTMISSAHARVALGRGAGMAFVRKTFGLAPRRGTGSACPECTRARAPGVLARRWEDDVRYHTSQALAPGPGLALAFGSSHLHRFLRTIVLPIICEEGGILTAPGPRTVIQYVKRAGYLQLPILGLQFPQR